MTSFIEDYITEYLKFNGIDLKNVNYKDSKNYNKIKKEKIPLLENMSLDELIDSFLSDRNKLLCDYKSIYDMGSDYELNDNECSDSAVAKEIITIYNLLPENNIEAELNDFVKKFTRSGGLIERLKTFLDFDLEKFDKNNKKYKCERCKILYFFYTLENIYFPKTNILMLLSKPSMENIDNSGLGWKTYNGWIIKLIKSSLEKELQEFHELYKLHIWPSPVEEIKKEVAKIVTTWDYILENANKLMDFLYAYGEGSEFDFKETIRTMLSDEEDSKKIEPLQNMDSPIKMLYLKIIQHEFLGNIKDIQKINNIQKNYDYSVPPEIIEEMKKLHYSTIDFKKVDDYIDKNALRISKYVYLKQKPNKDEVRKIRSSKKKIHKWIDFCFRAKPLLNSQDISNELQIISFLQAVILDDPRETFDYIFHNYQDHFKHKPQVQGALKNDNHVIDALQCYWIRKVTDRWYANIGRCDVRIKVRELEQACDSILEKILNKSSLDGMRETHILYYDKIDPGLITTTAQLHAVQKLINYLNTEGFKYTDSFYLIRYVFLYPPEIPSTLESLKLLIKDAIMGYELKRAVTLESHDENGKEMLTFNFVLTFDYQLSECQMQDFELLSNP